MNELKTAAFIITVQLFAYEMNDERVTSLKSKEVGNVFPYLFKSLKQSLFSGIEAQCPVL